MIRNKRAFPYQVQGLEMKLFASGEYKDDENKFVLDNNIKANKLYYVVTYTQGGADTRSYFADFLEHPHGDEVTTVQTVTLQCVEINRDTHAATGCEVEIRPDSNICEVFGDTSVFNGEMAVIYIYEIPLLPKGSVN